MIRTLLKRIVGERFTEYDKKYIRYNLGIILTSFCIFPLLLLFLPESIPVLHQGDELIYVPSTIGVFIPPVVMTIIEFTFSIQKRTNKFNTFLLAGIAAVVFVYYVSLI